MDETNNVTDGTDPSNFDCIQQNTLKTVTFLTAMRTPFAQKKTKFLHVKEIDICSQFVKFAKFSAPNSE